MDQALLAQRVQLMMHSDNVLYERDHYLKTAVSLWSELSDLQRVEGWEYRAALSALVQKYVVPDRGSRRHSTLWRGLQSLRQKRHAETPAYDFHPKATSQSRTWLHPPCTHLACLPVPLEHNAI